MAYKAKLLEPAARFVKSLTERDTPAARELALLLISLEQDPYPDGSRPMMPSLLPVRKGERVWERPPYVVVYSVDEHERLVEIGAIEEY